MRKRPLSRKAASGLAILLLTSCSISSPAIDRAERQKITGEIAADASSKKIEYNPTTANSAATQVSQLTYDDLLSLALRNNHLLKEAKARFNAAIHTVRKQGSLPDPHLSLSLMAMPANKLRETKTNKIMLSQMVPWFGKLALKEQVALLKAERMRLYSLELQNKLTQQIKDTWLELGYLKKLQQETDYNLELLRQTEEVVLNRYRTDGSSQAELIRIQIKIAEMETEVSSLAERAQPLLRQLTAFTGGTEIYGLSRLLLETPEPRTAPIASEIALRDELLKGNISLKQNELKKLSSYKMSALAEKDYYPDLTFSAEYMLANDELAMISGPDDSFLATVGITLPLDRTKYDSSLAAAHFNEEAAEQKLLGNQLVLESMVSKLFYRLRDTKRMIDLYSSTMQTKAEEALSTSIDSFSTGQTSFADLLEAEETLLNVRIALVRAKTDYLKTENSLNALLGRYAPSSPEDTIQNNLESGK